MSKSLPKTRRRHAAAAAALEPVAAMLGRWIADWCRSVGGCGAQLGAHAPFPYGLTTRFGDAIVNAPQIVPALGVVEVVIQFDPHAPYALPQFPGLRTRTRTWVYMTEPKSDAETAFTAFVSYARQLFLWWCPVCTTPCEVTLEGGLAAHAKPGKVAQDVTWCSGAGLAPTATANPWTAAGRAPTATCGPTTTDAVQVAPQPARGGARTVVIDFHATPSQPAVKTTLHAFRDDAGTPTVMVNGACAVHASPWPTATYTTTARQAIADVLTMAGVDSAARLVYTDMILARLDTVSARQ